MQFIVSLVDIGTKYIPNMKNWSVYFDIKTETSQRINAVNRSKGIYISVYSIYI